MRPPFLLDFDANQYVVINLTHEAKKQLLYAFITKKEIEQFLL
ncbi:hypothetical protein [Lactobacillus bombicola]|nr:hypothetical protein [Lactobacillus bombicola]